MLSTKILKPCVAKLSDFSLAFGKGWIFLLAAEFLQYYRGWLVARSELCRLHREHEQQGGSEAVDLRGIS